MIYRNLFNKANQLLEQFPVIVLLGARQVGKTTLARQIRPNWRYLDLENPNDFELLTRDPVFFFKQFPENIIIDEAQEFPGLFAVLRGVIDQNRQTKGRFILTGSSSLELLTGISESLAGRIAILKLGTLKANELYQQPLSDFYKLFSQKLNPDNLPKGKPLLTLAEMQKIWLRGGYPEPILNYNNHYYTEWMANYRDTYINRDIAKLFPHLNKSAYQRFLQMLCQLSGTMINKSQIGRSIEVSEKTISEYLNIVAGTFLWQPITSYEKDLSKSIVKMPKGYFTDNGLQHFLLKIHDQDDLYHHPKVGSSFEGFVIEELYKGLQALAITNWEFHFYRTRNQAEIDLIIDGNFGVLPIEIKQGSQVARRELMTLTRFIEEQNLPFGLLINQAEEALWLTPRIYQLPINWL
ncbi:MAG TPA: ATP-binding protein [Gammaproteobacteria bacterium]|nr:ATP-binding protein [Gammaproteobacteria bacterium]